MTFSKTETVVNSFSLLLASGLIVVGALGIRGILSPVGVSVTPIVFGGSAYILHGLQAGLAQEKAQSGNRRTNYYYKFQSLLMMIGITTLILGSIAQAGKIAPLDMSAASIGLGGASILAIALMAIHRKRLPQVWGQI